MADISLSSSNKALHAILHWARLFFTPLSLLVIAWFIWDTREYVVDVVSNSNGYWLLFAFFLWVITNFLAPLTGVFTFKTCQVSIPYRDCLHIHTSRLPAKYLPGGIWHSVGRANDYFKLGHGKGIVGAYFLLENFLLITVTLTMSYPLIDNLITSPQLFYLTRLAFSICIISLLVFPSAVKFLTKGRITLNWNNYFKAISALVVYWSIAGLCFASYITSFSALSLTTTVTETAGVYIFSWCLGYLALFAPQGIGVSEFIIGNLMASNQTSQLLAFLIGFRLLVLIADIFVWAFMGVVNKRS